MAEARKIRVVFYCNQLGLGGTERSMELFCKYLDKNRYDVHAVSRIFKEKPLKRLKIELGALVGHRGARAKKAMWANMNVRVPIFQQLLGMDHVHFARNDRHLRELLVGSGGLQPDILHVWYSGRAEPPISDEAIVSKVPHTISTNSFEIENTAPSHRYVKRYFFPSNWVRENVAPWAKGDPRAGVFYSPIEGPETAENLRAELGIPKDAFVLGRVGRPDPGIHHPISLLAYQRIQTDQTWFLALSPPPNMVEQAASLGLKNFVPLPTVTQEGLSKFYNTIDVLAHARQDGETFGCNIAEAMMHGKPAVSHLTPFMNAQTEVIGDSGHVCAQDNWEEYAEWLKRLRDDRNFRAELSRRALARAKELFEVHRLTQRLESLYQELISGTKSA